MFEFPISVQQAIVMSVTLGLIVLLFFEKTRPSFIFFSAVLIFVITGVVSTDDLLNSLANESILSIFLLIFITAGLREHFNIIGFFDKLFGKKNSPQTFLLKMSSGVTVLSSFLNNTPIVALLMPYVYQWSKRNNIAPSKLLIPLSYAAIVGGMITVIGTSTNLVLNGLIESKAAQPLGVLDFLYPGILVSLGGVLFLYFFGFKLLPNRTYMMNDVSKQSREYLVETKIGEYSALTGKTVTEAHLRNLRGIYLFEIEREGRSITPVDPDEVLQNGDSLFFAGETNDIVELLSRDNELMLPTNPNGRKDDDNGHNLIEAVIPVNSELVGRTLKELEFRENYDAAVVAIHRNGEKLRGKIGEIEMEAGDLLLISTGKSFYHLLKTKRSLYLVSVLSKTSESKPLARKGFVGIVLLMVSLLLFTSMNLFLALLIITSYMVITKLLSISGIKKELDLDLMIILVASLTFSVAIIDTGMADLVANQFIEVFQPFGNTGILIGLYLITILLTSFVTNVAAISIVFPVAYALGNSVSDVSMTALFVAIAFAASCSFHSPFSYQTNLMVYGPGGYKFKDFIKIGIPFTFLYSIISLMFILLYYNV